jgi:hypothetical protein
MLMLCCSYFLRTAISETPDRRAQAAKENKQPEGTED